MTKAPETPAQLAADLQDERLIRDEGLGGAVRAFGRRVRGGDLGSLPVVVGLIVIWVVFQILNPAFLSANNLVNLTLQCAAIGTISIGIVLVLLLGQIDLSVGSVSGVAAAILGVAFTQLHWPLALTVIVAILAGSVIGLLYGLLFTRFGVPSFVITLAGLLGFLGVQLWILGPNSSINIPYDSWIVKFAQQTFLPPWAAYALAVISMTVVLVKAVLLLVGLCIAVWYLSTDRGTGAMFLFFVILVIVMNFFLTRTKWGRSVFAVGGSVEAARRAGIKVNRIFISVFILCSTFAAIGGLLAAARLASVGAGSGGTDTNLNAIAAAVIGGTSLFGGRGSAWSALLGILVIQSISNGLTLLNLDSSYRFMITGAVLLLAVIIDSLSRRSRESHGQA